MQKRYSNINTFNNSSIVYRRKENIFIISWIYIFLIGSIFLCIISLFYKYTVFNIYYAKVVKTKEDNYIYMTVDSDFISIRNRNYLEIDGKETKCKLKMFSDKYFYLNQKKYWEVTYRCELDEELNVNDNVIEVRVDKRKTTLFKELVSKIKKGVKNARVKN